MHFQNMTDDEKETFRLYKSNSPFDGEDFFANHVNTSLATNQPLGSKWQEKIASLDSIIERSPSPQETTVYRAMLEMHLPSAVGQELVYPSYMSTAAEEIAVSRHFASSMRSVPAALLIIQCPAGTPMLDLESNQSFGGLEQEYLLPRNSKFNILSRKRESDQATMSAVMGYYAKSYSELVIYELEYVSTF
ncbi:ADP-ribosyltransferase [Stenotrophomonas lactitubi]|uniref:ADP-ribosyltransferase n=1 Tax=Stenotrophomonas lactitubi TaxID=2045214 RepID=UPI00320B7343